MVLPVWSAPVDPRVLCVRACVRRGDEGWRSFELLRYAARVLRGDGCEYVRVDHAGISLRLDVIEGTLLDRPVALGFDIPGDRDLSFQIDALCDLHKLMHRGSLPLHSRAQMTRQLLALHAFDARGAGLSLRAVAKVVLGQGDWPGDGEYRKSSVRRLVASGEALVRAGPGAVLR